ncbi:hypothetical protein SLS56_005544 [Neofusicoccum ribis]|uniref:Uncharacterized protein n=1 Tax=Neofusicoccum ribis TaxID=45134 RepID=A0ABR3STE9_9PEZI
MTSLNNFLISLSIIYFLGVLFDTIVEAVHFFFIRRTHEPEESESAADVAINVFMAPLRTAQQVARLAVLFALRFSISILVLLVRLAFAVALVGLVLRPVAPPTAEDVVELSSVLDGVLKPRTVPEHANSVWDGWLDSVGQNTVGVRYKVRDNAWDRLVAAVLEIGDCTWTPSPWAADNWRGTTNCAKVGRKPVKVGGWWQYLQRPVFPLLTMS